MCKDWLAQELIKSLCKPILTFLHLYILTFSHNPYIFTSLNFEMAFSIMSCVPLPSRT